MTCYTYFMKGFFVALFVLFVVSFSPSFASAQVPSPRLAECDVCGYCQGKQIPGAWESCRTCLYPTTGKSLPTENKTLLIDQKPGTTFNQQVTPYPGRYYTQLGCLNTDLGDFRNPAAAGGITNQLLNKLIFPGVGALAFFYLIYGAFLVATAQGEPDRLNQGKQVVNGAVIGLIFVLCTVFIVNFIANGIIRLPGFGAGPNARIQGRVLKAGLVDYQGQFNGNGTISLENTATITIQQDGRTISSHTLLKHWDSYNTPPLDCGKTYKVSITTSSPTSISYAMCSNKIVLGNCSYQPLVGNSVQVTLKEQSSANPLCFVDLYWKIQ